MKKSFLRILSITVTLLLIAGMVMMPVSAAVPETGMTSVTVNKITNTIYRASDASEATDADGNAAAWLSSDSSVWKFAVGTLGDTFKPSSADFAAPTAEAVKGGQIKLSWTAPIEGKATVKVIADGYNKEVVTNASSITLGDTEIGKAYQVQVTVGDKSSQILSYNNIYSPISTKNTVNDTNYITVDRNHNDAGEPTNQWAWTIFNVKDYKDIIGENTGFIFRVESIIDPEKTFNFTHYYDSNNQTKIKEWKEYESADQYINSADSGIAFSTTIGSQETRVSEEDNLDKFVANADSTRTVYRIDTTGKGIRTDVNSTAITAGGSMKNNFRSGYIIVPFDVVGEYGLDFIKKYGVFSLTTSAFRYYPQNTYETAAAGWTRWIASEAGKYEYSDIDMDRSKEINIMWDREIFLGDAGFISDIDAFIATCTDITSAETANVDFTKLASSSETKDTVYLNTLTNGVLSDANVASTYTVATNEISYTSAAGEKMELGFTVPVAGIYDLSCPINVADYAQKGVYTRVIKESADGTKTVLQAEAAYNGERHLALFTEQLEAGDTVWFEAWANSAATIVELGIPQIVTHDSNGRYSYYNYMSDLISNVGGKNRWNVKETSGAIDAGYFLNPFRIDTVTTVTDETTGTTTAETIEGQIYDMAISSVVTAEGITLVQDMMGLTDLKVGDTATELYNRLTPYEFVRQDSRYILASDPSCRRKNGLDAANKVYNKYSGTTTLYSNNQVIANIGYDRAFAGLSNNEPYYFNSGAYLRFTAPADGSVNFVINPGGTTNIENVVLLHNSTVKAVGVNPIEVGAVVVDVVKGDEVTLCLATKSNQISIDLREPKAIFTPAETNENTVTFNEKTDNLMPALYADGAKITLPAVAKNGAIFQGWNDGTTTYAAGTEYTVNADTEFTAQYIYYGDLDGIDGIAQAADVTVLRKMIIGAGETGATDKANLTGDIDANGKINLTDLVKIKKMSAGIDVTVGAK